MSPKQHTISATLPTKTASVSSFVIGEKSSFKDPTISSHSNHLRKAPENACTSNGFSQVHDALSATQDLLQNMKLKSYQKSKSSDLPPRSKSAASTKSLGALANQGGILQRDYNNSNTDRNSDSFLTQRVSTHLEQLQKTTREYEQKMRGSSSEDRLATFGCKNLVVGSASSQSNSNVIILNDRLEYNFHHTTKGKIKMIVYVKDIYDYEFQLNKRLFSFKVANSLNHYVSEYDPTNEAHALSITFLSTTDFNEFKQTLSAALPLSSALR